MNLSRPDDSHALRVMLGGFNYLRKHIWNFATITGLLWHLLKKKVEWDWGPEQEKAFCNLKQALRKAPALKFPEINKLFVIKLAATQQSLAAVLMQEIDRKLIPVANKSRRLTPIEQQFGICERECLASVWAIEAFALTTGTAPIIIQTPHSPLKYILSGKLQGKGVSNTRMTQWTLMLTSRDVTYENNKQAMMLPYAFLMEGEEHESPLPETELKLVEEAPQVDEVLSLVEKEVWFTYGGSYHENPKPYMGYAAVQIDGETISGSMSMTSAQGAEVRALSDLLKQKK
ncbi:unnamed protein product [Natator depressus]